MFYKKLQGIQILILGPVIMHCRVSNDSARLHKRLHLAKAMIFLAKIIPTEMQWTPNLIFV